MKTIATLFILVLTNPMAYAQRPTTTSPKRSQAILFDFRNQRDVSVATIPTGTQRSVLSKVFRNYLTDEAKCKSDLDTSNDSDPLRAARNSGQIVPSIVDMASGSFTTAGRPETAYVISVSECNASHADNFGTKRVAIFAGQELIADVDVDFNNSIVRKTDLNGDGINELLMTTGDMHQGVLTQTADLLEFSNGRVRVIEDFGTVTEDSCGSGIADSASKAAVISLSDVTHGKMPRMQIDNYEASCRRARRWRFVSSGKMQ
jgi:hypothetical protein